MKGALREGMPEAHTAQPAKPGLHSYNFDRRLRPKKDRHRTVKVLRTLLLLCGLAGVGFYAYTLADQYIYQAYGNWSFEQQISGRQVGFVDWMRERTPFGGVMNPPETAKKVAPPAKSAPVIPLPTRGTLLGRVEIGRLNLSQIVREGVDDDVLKRAVGHVPSTALPGQVGNFAIAAHRDTLFRALKDIKKDDQVSFQSAHGTYIYKVVSTRIVRPTDVSVLSPEGDQKLLTMITCYPFYYVGSAPKRFIVKARLVSSDAAEATTTVAEESPPKAFKAAPPKKKVIKQIVSREPRRMRGSLHSGGQANSSEAAPKIEKKHGFWHRLFHRDKG